MKTPRRDERPLPMKILYDHQIFSRQRYGGVSRYFHELANHIPTMGSDVATIFAPLYINEYVRSANAIKPPNGLHVPKFPGSVLACDLADAAIGNMSVRFRRGIDILHHTYFSKGYAPRSAARVVTVYDMIHELFPASFAQRDRTRERKRRAVLQADHVICISESTRQDLLRIIGLPAEKTSVVHLGHALTSNETVDPETAPPIDRPYLLYVGKRDGYKNFNRLLVAYAQSSFLKEAFSLVCFGGGGLSPTELATMKMLGLRLEHVLPLSGNDATLSMLYARATAFVYPSLYEGFGIPPLEAMSHGCPVACSNTSSLPEVVGNAAELFDPNDADDIRMALERVAGSAEHSRSLAALGYQRVKHFSWEKCARETLNEYRRILGSRE